MALLSLTHLSQRVTVGLCLTPQTLSMQREQACNEVISKEAQVRRELHIMAAKSPAAGKGQMQDSQVSHPEEHANLTVLCPAWLSHTLRCSQAV